MPAALQARDVAVGLRMGVERDLKITRTVEKLNRVIHQSGLTSRFISLFFGELETNGNLTYINAGHPPPLLRDESGFHSLSVGGLLLGPTRDATYKMGFAHVDRGACLTLYTDGIVECGTAEGEAFGEDRLRAWIEAWRQGPSAPAIEDLFERLRTFRNGAPLEDDVPSRSCDGERDNEELAMKSLIEIAERQLSWTQPNAFKRNYELRAGDDVAATLDFKSSFGSFATGRSGDGCWTFKRVGFWQTRATIRECERGTEIGSFKNNTWKGGGTWSCQMVAATLPRRTSGRRSSSSRRSRRLHWFE